MRVVINQIVALGPKTGIGHYTAELLRCLRRQAGADEIDAFPEGWVRRLRETGSHIRARLEPRSRGEPTNPPMPSAWDRLKGRALAWLRQYDQALAARLLKTACARRKYDLYHEPNLIPLPCDRPTVATLHDLSVLLHPEWHPADRVAHFEKHFHRGLRHCTHFLAISEFGRQEVIRTLHVPPERVTRTYMGVRPGLGRLPDDEVAAALRRLGLPARYLLYLGTIEPRKNVLRLLQAYCALPPALRERWPLLLVGRWGWGSREVAEYFQREARHRGVIQVGYVAEEHLPAIYNGARALVFPSFYEGFGLPPVEMMACGGAVLASTAGAVAEVVGGRAHLVEPEDTDGWRAALKRVVADDDWWQSLRRGVMEAARRFTWEACAADTLRVYRSLCGGATAHRPLAA
ncbi:MAG TPA: glycosyltransferase family 1 protein [Gemmataceae bacterium]|nr:glycosyltransferase family 1 protein [Gemmataceae bacterium]